MDSGNENDIIEKIDPKENKDDIESEKKIIMKMKIMQLKN